MLILFGRSSLEPSQHHCLLAKLQKQDPRITRISSRAVYFIDGERLYDHHAHLVEILECGGAVDDTLGARLIVIPRFGTISPWASRATDIAHKVGLGDVRRIERGIIYYVSGGEPHKIAPLIYDRMTEEVIYDVEDGNKLFRSPPPAPLTTLNVLAKGREALEEVNSTMGLALSEQEITYLTKVFIDLGRNPTDVEIYMFSQVNSEHCRHKIFNATWDIDDHHHSSSLFAMIKNTYAHNSTGVLSAYKDNAAVISGFEGGRFFPAPQSRKYGYTQEPIHILIKVETHNHPTAIAPFQGAATGAGGEIRDEGATGVGAKPKIGLIGFTVSNLNIEGYRRPWEVDLYGYPHHIASPLDIIIQGSLGGAKFNNEFGRPNLAGYFRTYEQKVRGGAIHFGYHKPIMLAGGLGNIRAHHIEKKAINPGDHLVCLGGAAMRVGLGGGAASSLGASDQNQDLDFASVQRGNPEMERRCQEVIDRCWQMEDNPISFIHDVGAGGVSNAFPELVKDGHKGGIFDLRALHIDEPGMSPREIWSNESQERYVLAIPPQRMEEFAAICARERCPFSSVGVATDDQHLTVRDDFFDNRPVDIPMDVLFGNTPQMHRHGTRVPLEQEDFDPTLIDPDEAIDRVLSLPAVASKSFLITIGDRSVTGMVAQDQMVGPWQVPVADCAVSTTSLDTYTGEVMAIGERTPIAVINGPASGRMALGEVLTNMAGCAIEQVSDIKLSANWMAAAGQENEDVKLFDTVKALGCEMCPHLGVTIPVGKDSMSMKMEWVDQGQRKAVISPMSVVLSGFAPVGDVRKVLTPQLQSVEDTALIYVDLGNGKNRIALSALAQVYNGLGREAPDVDHVDQLKAFFDVMRQINKAGNVLAYHDRSDGGLVTTLAEMAFAGRMGVSLDLSEITGHINHILFTEELGAVLQVRNINRSEVLRLFAEAGVPAVTIGVPTVVQDIVIFKEGQKVVHRTREALQKIWSATSYHIQKVRDHLPCVEEEYQTISMENQGLHVHTTFQPDTFFVTGCSPKIAILREQGVNGHVEMAAAFDRAGFEAYDVHMNDLLSGDVALDGFHALVACGGFSYGDVLGAGLGWARSILHNSRLKDQFSQFFMRQDTLTLGVCNGCQMLSHLSGLIDNGESLPKFTPNLSTQFEARFVMVEIQKSPSMLFEGMEGSRLPVVVAHGEGRVKFKSPRDHSALSHHQQITLKYVDNGGAVTEHYPYNPNGSADGITGVCSRDGRINMMMPHPERVYRGVQHTWTRFPSEQSPWMQIFYNMYRWTRNV